MDLSTHYLGFKLDNPLIPGASPLSDDLGVVRQLEDCGAPMLIMHSIFQEQLDLEQMAVTNTIASAEHGYAEALSYLPEPAEYRLGPDEYLEQISRIKRAVRIPVVASLNGRTKGGWIDYAKKIQQAGADGLELNIYNPVLDPTKSSDEIEKETLEVVGAVRQAVRLPLAIKLSPNYTSLPYFARQLSELGAGALVLFNRYYQADFDIEQLDARRSLNLSTSEELLPRLRAVAALSGVVRCDLAITGGVHTTSDVIKATMAGAAVVQMVSALLERGPMFLGQLRDDLQRWLETHEYVSLTQMRGSMNLRRTPNPAAFERGNYMKILSAWEPA